MTDTEKKKYIRAVGRRLNLPPDVKKRIMTDFVSAIQSRQDAGKTDAGYACCGRRRSE